MGFDNINMDLIIGLPEEDLEDVRRTMEEIKALDPDSITVHSLAIKRAARLNMFKEKYGDLKITNTQEMIDLTAAYAREMGQEPYYLSVSYTHLHHLARRRLVLIWRCILPRGIMWCILV